MPPASRKEPPGAGGGGVLVSVIVAVYNPGHAIDALLESLDAQTLPSESYEVILVDDDSTDGTRDRLREWAKNRPHATVLHNTPNSGWPGRPRNLGIDAAQGEFIFFADHDDRFHPDGLRRLVAHAHEVGADVVVGKEVGVGPGRLVPPELFRRDVPDARLGRHPILKLLTPHKLFRTAMVREHGIRFPEGRVRLEDHAFVVACYFAANRIAIYSSGVCYYWVGHEGHTSATFHAVDPAVYYESVARVLAVVEANTEPGELRDRLYSQWYRAKMLHMLSGERLRWQTWSHQRRLVREMRTVVTRFGLGERQRPYLGAFARAADTLLREGTLGQLRRLGAVERGISARVDRATVSRDDHTTTIAVRAHLAYRSGRAVRLRTDASGTCWSLPLLARSRILRRVDVTDLVGRTSLEVIASDAQRGLAVLAALERATSDPPVVAASCTVVIDERQWSLAGAGVPRVRARLNALGWSPETPLPVWADAASTPNGPVSAARRLALAVARPPVRALRLLRRMLS